MKMMRMRSRASGVPPVSDAGGGGGGGGGAGGEKEWEMRPCGMLVQKRSEGEQNRAAPPTIRVRVKYGSIYHEINISSQATFGELKKMLSGTTGLHHQDQKLIFKDKERDSNAFLDISGVKDKSKLVLVEDPISKEKRYIEMRKNAKMEKAAKTISEISLEVDRLAAEVSGIESVINKGGKVAGKDVENLIELLMSQLLKLDEIIADGDVKLQRKMQVKRVQKYVETLDMLKIKNAIPTTNPAQHPLRSQQQQGHPDRQAAEATQQEQASRRSSSGDVVITTQWETFDSVYAAPLPATASTSRTVSSSISPAQPKFDWDLLL